MVSIDYFAEQFYEGLKFFIASSEGILGMSNRGIFPSHKFLLRTKDVPSLIILSADPSN